MWGEKQSIRSVCQEARSCLRRNYQVHVPIRNSRINPNTQRQHASTSEQVRDGTRAAMLAECTAARTCSLHVCAPSAKPECIRAHEKPPTPPPCAPRPPPIITALPPCDVNRFCITGVRACSQKTHTSTHVTFPLAVSSPASWALSSARAVARVYDAGDKVAWQSDGSDMREVQRGRIAISGAWCARVMLACLAAPWLQCGSLSVDAAGGGRGRRQCATRPQAARGARARCAAHVHARAGVYACSCASGVARPIVTQHGPPDLTLVRTPPG